MKLISVEGELYGCEYGSTNWYRQQGDIHVPCTGRHSLALEHLFWAQKSNEALRTTIAAQQKERERLTIDEERLKQAGYELIDPNFDGKRMWKPPINQLAALLNWWAVNPHLGLMCIDGEGWRVLGPTGQSVGQGESPREALQAAYDAQ